MRYLLRRRPVSIAILHAVTVSIPVMANDPGYVDLNGVLVTPRLSTSISYDDNVFREDDSISRSSSVLAINPAVEFKVLSGESKYALTFEGVNKQHASVKGADYTDAGVTADIYHELNSRHRFDVELMAGRLHDSNSMDIKGHPPAYDRAAADVLYGFGVVGAPGQIDLFAGFENKDYKRPASLELGEGRDSLEKYYGATFSVRLMPKTRALFELKKRELSYTKIKDSGFDITSYFAGVSWDATAKTNGYFKAGRRSRKPDNPAARAEDYNAWAGGLSYQLLPYSLIQLVTGRDYELETDDTTETAFTRGDTIELSWSHEWSDRIRTASRVGFIDQDVQDFQGKTLKQRDVWLMGFSVDWDIRRWMTVSAGYARESRRERAKVENVTLSEYNRNLYTLGVTVTL